MHGVFESMRSYGGKVFMLDEHMQRFFESCKTSGIPVPIDTRKLKDIIKKRLRHSGCKDAYIRLSIDELSRIDIIVKEFKPHKKAFYTKGVSLKTASVRKSIAKAVEPRVKSQNYLNGVLARAESIGTGEFDSLMLSKDGLVAEATVSNIFAVKNGKLYTPPNHVGILDGITKRFVENIAQKAGIPTVRMPFTRHDLYNADEAFLTNTSMEIMPVVCVDGRKIGTGRPGALTKKLHSTFRREIGRWLR